MFTGSKGSMSGTVSEAQSVSISRRTACHYITTGINVGVVASGLKKRQPNSQALFLSKATHSLFISLLLLASLSAVSLDLVATTSSCTQPKPGELPVSSASKMPKLKPKARSPPQDDNNIFFLPEEGSDFFSGHVHQEGGESDFYHESETNLQKPLEELLGDQPAQFQPRTNWSHWISDNPTRFHVSQAEDKFLTEVSKVPPQHDFGNLPQAFGRRSWEQHCWDLWGTFKKLRGNTKASDRDLEPLMAILTYGMQDVVVVAPKPITIHDGKVFKNPPLHAAGSDPFLAEGVDRVHCSTTAYGSPDDMKLALFNKRFLIGTFNFNNYHWTSFVWDRTPGHLLIYDTDSANRGGHTRSAILAWRETLAHYGLPYNFSFFSFPAAGQLGDWECGYLGVYLLFLQLRGLTGLNFDQLTADNSPQAITIDGAKTTAALKPPALRFRDWILDS
ncbi:hypothetical protein BGZ61DRAFT_567540 [Ilyonectria robusta]|uniref:uncharacterized protein n=1 Tax=Ilyonectria robusta TaxID=1079257 RepID=UPI001E8EA2BB|nr:uncharacterized protein BGZ61DRAFT_567540 [Ilyonectria robusta]KAH8658944.1 hypothetical protein BGZ61DRAFT_567540 [Ilyonectria robusta]